MTRSVEIFPRMFRHLPASELTVRGLKKAKFTKMTDIQRATLLHALAGRDILGAAKTGSGKTLAFLIPVLENLYRARWGPQDGLGALIITPTRELAAQIFRVLRDIGFNHSFSAGLIIGGKSFEEEQTRILRMNIIIATPGRLLQHMDETPAFTAQNLKMLVLDEADQLLELGFKDTLNNILSNLPEARQTMLFSATQTTSVKDLARLSLAEPEYLAVHQDASAKTPEGLVQSFAVLELGSKIDFLASFITSHRRDKTIVFLATRKQVQFVYDMFCQMRPGVPLLLIHGKQSQKKRIHMYNAFNKGAAAVLFATDVAARGLDFAGVTWVLSLDAPDSIRTYIHRVGRTARLGKGGRAVLVLLPSEVGLADQLEQAQVPLTQVQANPEKLTSSLAFMRAAIARDPELKESAVRAFRAYARHVYVASDKSVFDVDALPLDEFAKSLGLVTQPKLKFLSSSRTAEESKARAHARKNFSYRKQAEMEKLIALMDGDSDESDESEDGMDGKGKKKKDKKKDKKKKKKKDKKKKKKKEKKMAKMMAALKPPSMSESGDGGSSGSESSGGEFMTMKRKDHGLDPTLEAMGEVKEPGMLTEAEMEEMAAAAAARNKRKEKKKRKRIRVDDFAENKTVFSDSDSDGDVADARVYGDGRWDALRERMAKEDEVDKAREREAHRAKRLAARIKAKIRAQGLLGQITVEEYLARQDEMEGRVGSVHGKRKPQQAASGEGEVMVSGLEPMDPEELRRLNAELLGELGSGGSSDDGEGSDDEESGEGGDDGEEEESEEGGEEEDERPKKRRKHL